MAPLGVPGHLSSSSTTPRSIVARRTSAAGARCPSVQRGAAAVKCRAVDGGLKGRGLPGRLRAGRHDVRVAGEAEQRSVGAAPRPEIIHVTEAHGLTALRTAVSGPVAEGNVGAGIGYINDSSGSVIDCKITDNFADYLGGGLTLPQSGRQLVAKWHKRVLAHASPSLLFA